MRKRAIAVLACGLIWGAAAGQADDLETVHFNELPLNTNSYWNGSDLSGGFLSQDVLFMNHFTDWGGGFYSWAGFAYSNVEDTNTAGYGNQYAVFSGSGVGGKGNYAVVYDDSFDPEADTIELPEPCQVRGLHVNNTTYAALSMLYGDAFSKQFGGASGDDPDWFLLTIRAEDESGSDLGAVETYLADYRSPDNSLDYVLDRWDWVDLNSFGPDVRTLHFSLSSSDAGAWGMNTPAYFALDSLVFVPKTEWAGKADLAVRDLAARTFRWWRRRWLYTDLRLANLGGQPSRGWTVVIMEPPNGRPSLQCRQFHVLQPGEEKGVRVYFGMLGGWLPHGSYRFRAFVLPAEYGSELTLDNNEAVATFDW